MKKSKTSLYLQMKKILRKENQEGDEREILETNRIIAVEMLILTTILIIFSIVYDTIKIQLNYDILSFLTLFHLISFIIGIVSLGAAISLCKKSIVSGQIHCGIIFSAIGFPPFLITQLLYLIKGYEIQISLISIILLPIFMYILYSLLNNIYKKAISKIDSEK